MRIMSGKKIVFTGMKSLLECSVLGQKVFLVVTYFFISPFFTIFKLFSLTTPQLFWVKGTLLSVVSPVMHRSASQQEVYSSKSTLLTTRSAKVDQMNFYSWRFWLIISYSLTYSHFFKLLKFDQIKVEKILASVKFTFNLITIKKKLLNLDKFYSNVIYFHYKYV